MVLGLPNRWKHPEQAFGSRQNLPNQSSFQRLGPLATLENTSKSCQFRGLQTVRTEIRWPSPRNPHPPDPRIGPSG